MSLSRVLRACRPMLASRPPAGLRPAHVADERPIVASQARCINIDSGVLGSPLETEAGPFNSSILDTDSMRVLDTSDFTTRLLVTIHKLREEKKSALWVKVHLLNGHLLGILGTNGFRFHHAVDQHAMLNLWLAHPSENKIPPFATHLVGVAGFVLNKKMEVLMVKERSKVFSGWKLPGGYANLGEEFGAAACREVFEETGIRCTFRSMLGLRHQHNTAFGRSDIYVITRLEAQNEDMRIDAHEVEDAKWVPLPTFREEASHPILKVVADLTKGLKAPSDLTNNDIAETEHPSVIPGRPPYKLYHKAL